MKKIVYGLLCLYFTAFADPALEKPFMTKEMLENDLETHEYQFFYTSTNRIPINGLTQKIIFSGSLSEYFEFIKNDLNAKRALLSNGTLYTASDSAFNAAINSASKTIKTSDIANNAVQGFGIGLVVNPMAGMLFGDDHYVQVEDYYEGEIPKTRIIKYIVSDESLPKDELKMIYDSSNGRSYHFNRGKTSALLSGKQYDEIIKTINKDQQ